MTSPLSSEVRSAPESREALPGWRTGLTAGVIAVGLNLAVLAIARIGGANMSARPSGQEAMTVGVLMIVAVTLVPVLIGSGFLAMLARRGTRSWWKLAIAGLVIGVVTAPASLTVEAESSTRAALAAMHLITGCVWFVVVRRALPSTASGR